MARDGGAAMESTEKAVVLKVGRFREIDAWVRLFSPGKGLFTAFAFGGCVSRRRFCGCLDPFNLVSFKTKTTRSGGYVYLQEAVLLAAYRRLVQGPERLGMAVNCLKFLEAAQLGTSGSRAAFELFLDILAALDGDPAPPRSLPLYFRARMAFDQGFRPDFETCHRCGATLGEAGQATLLVEDGRLFCPDCRQAVRGTPAHLGREALDILRAVSADRPDRWPDPGPGSRARMECGRAVDLFVRYHLGLTWDNGCFTRV